MAINYPAALDGTTQFPQPNGTQLVTSPDHALLHTNTSILGTVVENLLGTTGGTNILKNITSAGVFAVGANSSNVLQQAVSGTFNNSTLGTPAITGGTIGTATLSAPTIKGAGTNSGTISGGMYGTATIQGGTINNAVLNGVSGIVTSQTKSFTVGSIGGSTGVGTLFSYTIAANQLGTQNWLEIELWGNILNNCGTTETGTFGMNYNGTAIATVARSLAASTGTITYLNRAFLMNRGTANSQQGGFAIFGQETANGGNYMFTAIGTSGIDSTAIGTLNFTIAFNASNAALWMTVTNTLVRLN